MQKNILAIAPQFTPGPWKAKLDPTTIGEWTIRNESGQVIIATVLGHDADEQRDANARLIAAAPDMLTFIAYFAANFDTFLKQTNVAGSAYSGESYQFMNLISIEAQKVLKEAL